MDEGSAFSGWLRAVRGTRSVYAVSKQTGVHWSAIYRAEGGNQLLSLATLERLCVFYESDYHTGLRLMGQARMAREKERGKQSGSTGIPPR